ncbi:MAG: hypothetical protein JWN38_1007 [Candidatus Saccharibacteria bacterium]|nr:hypothetical protein [Candidatus Saccharibacteria bacterium]
MLHLQITKKLVDRLIAGGAVLLFGLGVFMTLPAGVHAAEVTLGGGRDTDANAVIDGGALSTSELVADYGAGKGSSSAQSIQDIYTYFGISATDISALGTTAVAGSVSKTGDVFVSGSATPVATGALTAGRQNLAGSSQVTAGGTTFYTRTPSVSFKSDSLPAFVVMQNGVFKYAIIGSCGNPVKATPKMPDFTIEKTVAKFGDSNFTKSVTAQSGDKVTYRVAVASTGAIASVNQVVRDELPAHATYVDGSLKLVNDGSAVDASKFFGSGITIPSFATGTTTTYEFSATVAPGEADSDCRTETLVNTAHSASPILPDKTSTATVNKTCKPTPPPTPTPAPPAPTPTPQPAPSLPATGTGSVLGLFVLASVVGSFVYRRHLSRRLATATNRD